MPAFRPEPPTEPYVIKGIPLAPGENPGIRQELRDLRKNPELWNLYLLGLWQFQLIPINDQLSYFQIAGIHGQPYQAWPPNDPNQDKIQREQWGFCTHTSILFVPWHRPYLALFETILQQAVVFVANQFTVQEGRERYLAAAKEFRVPYWDWARRDLPAFPDEATDSDVSHVVMPEALRRVYSNLKKEADGTVQIPNPLFSYSFKDDALKQIFPKPSPLSSLGSTTRYHPAGLTTTQSPADQKAALLENLTPYTRDVNKELPAEGSLCERVTYLIRSYELFAQVSNNKWDPRPDPSEQGLGFGSFEDIHNTVHVMTGGFGQDKQGRSRSGHMGSVPISAFDPIFWLHHANIDRVGAIWEAMHADPKNPQTWVTSKPSSEKSWVTKPGEDEGLKTPLAPFYKDKSNFYTSDDVRTTKMFGYAYPETKSWEFSTVDAYRKDIEAKLLAIYPAGSLATMITASQAGDQKPEATLRRRAQKLARIDAVDNPSTALTALSLAQKVSRTQTQLSSILPPLDVPQVEIPDGRSLAHLAKGNSYLEWLVNIKAVKHTLHGQYAVYVFLGRVPPEEPTTLYSVSPYHVGTFAPLGQNESTQCAKCQVDQGAGTQVTSQIPLTIALAERYFAGVLNSLDEDEVIRYLRENLHWEVVNKDGERLDRRDEVEGLTVGVVSNVVTLPKTRSQHPTYSPNVTLYPQITTKLDGSGDGRGDGTGVTRDNGYYN